MLEIVEVLLPTHKTDEPVSTIELTDSPPTSNEIKEKAWYMLSGNS